jgi:prepilin-type N-terminal cleavage/methylation domain-containing protein
MVYIRKKGFTLVEIITVVFIVALLSTALYIGSQPYMKRSRDTKRITDMTSYFNILDKYATDFESYPSNYGSG